MGVVNTTVGAISTDGTIDRDNCLYVSSGSGYGIELREGYLLGTDATNPDPSLSWQLTGIQFKFVSDGETYTIANRNNTTQSLSSSDSDIMVEVSRLG